MAKIKFVKLGTLCVDSATLAIGAPTHLNVNGAGHLMYLFQPRQLNLGSGLPVNRMRIDGSRLSRIKETDYIEVELPTEKIGTVVEDSISGYKGALVALTVHMNGCVHYVLQSAGSTKDGSPIEAIEVDPRSCVGAPASNPAAPVSPGDPFPVN